MLDSIYYMTQNNLEKQILQKWRKPTILENSRLRFIESVQDLEIVFCFGVLSTRFCHIYATLLHYHYIMIINRQIISGLSI